MTQGADDWDDTSTCVECGAEIWPEVARAFAIGPDTYLCFECAERRGGVFDADEDRWTEAPDLSGLGEGPTPPVRPFHRPGA